MRRSFSCRYRRTARHDTLNNKKESKQALFFGGNTFFEPFFRPANSASGTVESIHRKCSECEEEEKKAQHVSGEKEKDKKEIIKKEEKKEEEKIQKKEASKFSNSQVISTGYINSLNSKGQNLDAGTRSFFETRMGADFSDVKIHTGKDAAASSGEINALAYTIGNHIVFGRGKYRRDTNEGKHLLAHELTHILQQSGQKLQRKINTEGDDVEPSSVPGELTDEIEDMAPVFTSGSGTGNENMIAYANCNGVNVRGHTVANYDHGNYTASSTSVRRAESCRGCAGDECVTVAGNITSVFQANPQVTLPSVPSGLNECEHDAVRAFIDGTLSQHEQQHVAAFNGYNGTAITPFNYTGCREGFDAYILSVHNRIDAERIREANAESNALDPFNPPIPCNCPDPVP